MPVPPPVTEFQKDITEIAFKIGNFEIRWYGIFIMIGFALAIILSIIKMKFKYKIHIDPFYYFIFLGVSLAIFGARFWSCCIGDTGWNDFINIRQGGLAIQGGVMLVVLAACIFMPLVLKNPKYHVRDQFGPKPIVAKCSMWLYFDAVIPTILLGQAIGRWGNYFNGEVYGPIVDNNQQFCEFLRNYLPYMYLGGHYRLPLFLIEGIGTFVGFLVIYIGCEFIKVRKAADLSFLYFIWYGIVRISLEHYRAEQYTYTLNYITPSVWIGIGVIFIILNHCLCHKWRKIKIWESIKRLFQSSKNNKMQETNKQKRKIIVYRSEEERIYFGGM